MSDYDRRAILDIFGVAEEDLAALDAVDGYEAARALHEREVADFLERLQATAKTIAAGLNHHPSAIGPVEYEFDMGPLLTP